VLIGLTLIGLLATVGAIVRALYPLPHLTAGSLTGGWQGRDRTDIIYSEIVKIVKVPRGIGFWGDMVLTLRDGSRLELRAVPKFRDIYDYINENSCQKSLKVSSAVKQ